MQRNTDFIFNPDMITHYLNTLEKEDEHFYLNLLEGNFTGRLFDKYQAEKKDEVIIIKVETVLRNPAILKTWDENLCDFQPVLSIAGVVKIKEMAKNLFQCVMSCSLWIEFWNHQKNKLDEGQQKALYSLIVGALAYKSISLWAFGDQSKFYMVSYLTAVFNSPHNPEKTHENLEKKWNEDVCNKIENITNSMNDCNQALKKKSEWRERFPKQLQTIYADCSFVLLGEKISTLLAKKLCDQLSILIKSLRSHSEKKKILRHLSKILLKSLEKNYTLDFENAFQPENQKHSILLCYAKMIFNCCGERIPKKSKKFFTKYSQWAEGYKDQKTRDVISSGEVEIILPKSEKTAWFGLFDSENMTSKKSKREGLSQREVQSQREVEEKEPLNSPPLTRSNKTRRPLLDVFKVDNASTSTSMDAIPAEPKIELKKQENSLTKT